MFTLKLLAFDDVAEADAALDFFGFFTFFSNTACHVFQTFEFVDKLSPFVKCDHA